MTRAPLIEGVRDLTEIGRGGFGVVYRGTEVEFGREVAVKVLMQLQDERARRRFDRERRAMGAVSDHENIVTVYRGGITPENQPYLVMEYVRGGSLSDRLNTVGPLDWRQAAKVGAKLADALSVAHRAGILHRDVKPGNVFMTEHGEPKLGDFGIAVLDDGLASRTAGITASVAHAPPEIVDGQRGDERSDLYSLASTVYALTTGSAPFSRGGDDGLAAMLSRIAKEPPRPLHLESAASHFEETVLTGLSKRPEDRHATLGEFATQLRAAAATTTEVPAPAVPLATPPAERATPPGSAGTAVPAAAAPKAVTPIDPPIPAASSRRQISNGQLGFFALLLLAIAVFGGWAVANAVFEGDTGTATDVTTPTSQPVESTVEPVGTAVAATVVAAPTAQPTRAPQPTAVPSPEPDPTPGATTVPTVEGGGGVRGSAFVPAGFTRVADNSGAIQFNVPTEWTEREFDLTDPETGEAGIPGRAIAVGGTVADDGSVDVLDVTRSGLYIFAERAEFEPDPDALLDRNLETYPDCARGERSQILMNDGNAHFQILECDRADGAGTSGVIVYSMVLRDDPTVGVSMAIQFSDKDEVESLGELLGSIRINANNIPAPGEVTS